jgi:hypothetical protein
MNWTIDGSLELQNLDIIGSGKRICMIDCDDDTVSDYDHMANAQLIAAAPDLLAALEDAVAALADANYYPSELKRMQSVIAKARGA